MTLEDVGGAGGLDWRQVQRIERCEHAPTLRTIAKLCNAFGLDPRDLF